MRVIALLMFPVWLCGAADFAGSTACVKCHSVEVKKQSGTHHATALRPVSDSRLPELLTGTLHERSGVTLDYTRSGEGGLTVTARKGSDIATMALDWAFGSGAQGITPVGRFDGKYIEHRVSWYRLSERPARTLGHPGRPSPDATSALGLPQRPETIYRCFNCHATNVQQTRSGPDLSHMSPGVQCERCHGPGAEHARTPAAKNILNPGRFDAKSLVLICAECHRSPVAGSTSEMPELDDPSSIRFQPVGFLASRCFKGSKTFSCLSCHDPHEDARPASDAAYTNVCLSCHEPKTRGETDCRRASKENCLPCHMQASSPEPHLRFTDHRIRVY
jgi:predicted CXXCH cytochrome family protein